MWSTEKTKVSFIFKRKPKCRLHSWTRYTFRTAIHTACFVMNYIQVIFMQIHLVQ